MLVAYDTIIVWKMQTPKYGSSLEHCSKSFTIRDRKLYRMRRKKKKNERNKQKTKKKFRKYMGINCFHALKKWMKSALILLEVLVLWKHLWSKQNLVCCNTAMVREIDTVYFGHIVELAHSFKINKIHWCLEEVWDSIVYVIFAFIFI